MTEPKKYRKKPIEIEAMQWDGKFHSAEPIARWLNGRAVVWPVPRGYEHHRRRGTEQDRSRGDVLDTAPAFLSVYGLGGSSVRVDAGSWFIVDNDNVSVLTREEFAATYEAVES
ncbi:hypothetical protein A5788_22260 [Gordonia sp. 852002-50816_SCH5313054-c]|uniref:hypothetical protein n=1 Tax=unclassified Gordonia (in: high G+C Gram-positive bacteria) TaxID=2657482 RepID=UPI0007EAB5AE|nr:MULTISPECIES: hypothetical protein [unclassified Gordonia (in: high G+C Gram-positive bacteria)]OBC12164.1 hypothetical protein A5788_22260 [Gordonia sp. 852002-50816_SCH5313054-c]OBC17589.1 hypothetical protein A5786_18880 [Gordonia sp. 852002-50816_SCH5313054-a]